MQPEPTQGSKSNRRKGAVKMAHVIEHDISRMERSDSPEKDLNNGELSFGRTASKGGYLFQKVEVGENDKCFVRSITRIAPAFEIIRVEEIRHQSVRVISGYMGFQNASTLEVSKTFQFIARKPAEEVEDGMAISRSGFAKEGTNQRIA